MTSEGPQPKQVLIVDDDVILRDVLSLVLAAEGFEVLLAESGEEALSLLQQVRDSVSIVLTDMHMPGIHGVALAQRLQAVLAPSTLLIGMSGSQPQEEEMAAFRAFLQKPFSTEEFLTAVQSMRSDQAPQKQALASEGSSAPILNEEIYARLAAIMPTAQLRELYRMTLEDVRRRLDLMREAAGRGDDAICREEAHSIKGGCSMVGAAELAALAASAESSAEPHLATLADFDAACGRLEDILDARNSTVVSLPDGE